MRLVTVSPPEKPRTEAQLTSRGLDFWLLGGASIVLWAFMILLEGQGRSNWAVDHHFQNLVALSGSLALVGNYPHFMASYKIAYSQGGSFIRTNWLQLVAVPIVLCAAIAASYVLFNTATPGGSFPGLNAALTGLGLDTAIGLNPSLGKELMGLMIQFMFFTVGWHYAKQTYGCMRVMAHFDGYSMSPKEWRLIKLGLFSVWFCSFIWANTGNNTDQLHGIFYASFGLPSWMNGLALTMVVFCVLAAVLTFQLIHKETGKRPSANMLVAPVAFVLWWLPPFVQMEFYLWIVPFFHSIQYLAFVYRLEQQRIAETNPQSESFIGGLVALSLVLVGFTVFELAPNALDSILGTQEALGVWFFFAAAVLFINVHHYFIDNVIWRFENPRIRRHLLG